MSAEKKTVFLSVFRKLKQNVIWKWDAETMEDLPDNVRLFKWVPQQDILAHPNTKLFITSAGQSSYQETLCQQTPVVSFVDSEDFSSHRPDLSVGCPSNS